MGKAARTTHTVCPVCTCMWAIEARKPGALCLDQSRGQERPCVGRVMTEPSFYRAEWRLPGSPEQDAGLERRGPR